MVVKRLSADWRSLALTLIALAAATVWAAEARGPEVYIECVAIAVIHVRFRMAAARAKGWKRPMHLLIAAGRWRQGSKFIRPFCCRFRSSRMSWSQTIRGRIGAK